MHARVARAHPVDRAVAGLSELAVASAFLAARTQPWWGERVRILCPLLELTGVPCPTCGGTRALVALAQADVLGALAWNPMVALAGMLAVAWSVAAVAMLVGLVQPPAIPTALPARVRLAVPVLVLLNEAWLLLTLPR